MGKRQQEPDCTWNHGVHARNYKIIIFLHNVVLSAFSMMK
jgi:hypothetical protein